jgi:hypothetical protein
VGSREYAVGADPFRWPEELRTRVMAGRGAEGDDASAFPRARRAMVPEEGSICNDMLRWKETILEKGGVFLFPGADKHKRRKLMKGVINGFDMDSGLDAWRKKKEADTGKTLKGYEIKTGKEGEKTFSLEKYRKAQAQSTQWMADRSARMVEHLQSRVETGTTSWRKAGLTTYAGNGGRVTGGRTYKESKEATESVDERKGGTRRAEEKIRVVMGEATTSTSKERKHE